VAGVGGGLAASTGGAAVVHVHLRRIPATVGNVHGRRRCLPLTVAAASRGGKTKTSDWIKVRGWRGTAQRRRGGLERHDGERAVSSSASFPHRRSTSLDTRVHIRRQGSTLRLCCSGSNAGVPGHLAAGGEPVEEASTRCGNGVDPEM
jgi:hypothetical protein